MVKKLVLFYFTSILLFKQVVSHFDNFVIEVYMALYKVIEVWFQASDDVHIEDLKPYNCSLSFYIIDCKEFVPFILCILYAW